MDKPFSSRNTILISVVLFDSVDKTEWSGVFCLNLSKYKILLQDFPEIIGVILITLNTAFFGFKKFSLTKHNKIRECINKKTRPESPIVAKDWFFEIYPWRTLIYYCI